MIPTSLEFVDIAGLVRGAIERRRPGQPVLGQHSASRRGALRAALFRRRQHHPRRRQREPAAATKTWSTPSSASKTSRRLKSGARRRLRSIEGRRAKKANWLESEMVGARRNSKPSSTTASPVRSARPLARRKRGGDSRPVLAHRQTGALRRQRGRGAVGKGRFRCDPMVKQVVKSKLPPKRGAEVVVRRGRARSRNFSQLPQEERADFLDGLSGPGRAGAEQNHSSWL